MGFGMLLAALPKSESHIFAAVSSLILPFPAHWRHKAWRNLTSPLRVHAFDNRQKQSSPIRILLPRLTDGLMRRCLFHLNSEWMR